MAVRISSQTLQSSVYQAIASGQQRVMKLQQELSDGLAIHVPSDDPVGSSMTMWYQEQVRNQNQYQRDLDSAVSQLTARQSSLQQMQDILSQISAEQTSGADDSLGATGRASLAQEIGQQLESLVELGNTQYAGTYVFGGKNSTAPPLVAQRDVKGNITGVQLNPQGVSGAWQRSVGPDVSLTLEANAADLFGKNGSVFQTIQGLQKALSANDGDAVRAAAAPLGQAQDTVDLATTAVGSLIDRANNMSQAASQASTLYEEGRSQAEDLPTAQAMVDYQSAQNALQAALSSGSQILKMSLLDYLS